MSVEVLTIIMGLTDYSRHCLKDMYYYKNFVCYAFPTLDSYIHDLFARHFYKEYETRDTANLLPVLRSIRILALTYRTNAEA